MALVKEFEGQKWVLQDDVDGLIRDRVGDTTAKRRAAEAKVSELEGQVTDLTGKANGADSLMAQVAELRDQLGNANSKYDRHSAIGAKGISDPEQRTMIEGAYDRAMSGLGKKDIVPITDWLDGAAKEHSVVSAWLNPETPPGTPPETPPGTPPGTPPVPDPKLNQGTKKPGVAPVTAIDRLVSGQMPDYAANRTAIAQEYYSSRNLPVPSHLQPAPVDK